MVGFQASKSQNPINMVYFNHEIIFKYTVSDLPGYVFVISPTLFITLYASKQTVNISDIQYLSLLHKGADIGPFQLYKISSRSLNKSEPLPKDNSLNRHNISNIR